jgi:hypothetical protein
MTLTLGANAIKLARDKHSSLLRKSVNYGQKKFYNIDTRATGDAAGESLDVATESK